jgi:hypothetical protein
LQVSDVVVERNGRGVSGAFSDLEFRAVEVANNASHGLSIAASSLDVSNLRAVSNGGVGLLVCNSSPGGSIQVDGGQYNANGQGGIAVIGGAAPVSLTKVHAKYNLFFGAYLSSVASFAIVESELSQNVSDPEGRFGDGLDAWSSTGGVLFSKLVMNDRAGLAAFEGSEVSLQENFFSNPINLNTESGSSLHNNGGNVCQPPVCQAISSGSLAPPVPSP